VTKTKIEFTAIVDTREQKPLKLEYKKGQILKSVRSTLYTGDYSIKGLEQHIAIERKSLDDLMGCIGVNRDRFEKEIIRLKAYPVRCIVVESTWKKIEEGNYRSRVHATAAIGTLMGWIAQGIPIIMCDTHYRAGVFVSRMMMITAMRRINELKSISI
jgi:ERCC4-type nuclease